jgi:uncharacterized protein (DUF427 family)
MLEKRIKPGPGQESVWDYPRPPWLEQFQGHIRIVWQNEVIADTNEAYRILETSHPPTFYLPPSSFKEGVLKPADGRSFCEFKGSASYFDLTLNEQISHRAAWCYQNPNKVYAQIKDYICVYAHKVGDCFVNDARVEAQEGDFYGGWIYDKIVGPFKGAPGTWGW